MVAIARAWEELDKRTRGRRSDERECLLQCPAVRLLSSLKAENDLQSLR